MTSSILYSVIVPQVCICIVLLYDQYCTMLVYQWYDIAKMYQQCLWLFSTVEYVDMKSAVPIVKYSNSNGVDCSS